MNFYDLFIKLCNSKNTKPSIAAREIGISKSNVSNWKRRNTFPTDANLQKIADYFGVTVDYLLGNEKTSAENGEGNKSNYNIFAKNGITGMHDETTDNEQSDKLAELILATRELPPEKIDMLIKMAESIK